MKKKNESWLHPKFSGHFWQMGHLKLKFTVLCEAEFDGTMVIENSLSEGALNGRDLANLIYSAVYEKQRSRRKKR